MKEGPYHIVDTSEDEHDLAEMPETGFMMMAMTLMVIIEYVKPADGVSMNPGRSTVRVT